MNELSVFDMYLIYLLYLEVVVITEADLSAHKSF